MATIGFAVVSRRGLMSKVFKSKPSAIKEFKRMSKKGYNFGTGKRGAKLILTKSAKVTKLICTSKGCRIA